ncbi:uncharacterized protein TNCV_1996981 [Trichonephila clavipes]|uniref:Transposable element Tc3 transposase n=1 Tax=Trichonephila clavipes TaxID=2585209 RepID=A0A8X6RT04_TRICX|nr:uncharacterized protein TNCV_1996981 [Trichonephila clavipes]
MDPRYLGLASEKLWSPKPGKSGIVLEKCGNVCSFFIMNYANNEPRNSRDQQCCEAARRLGLPPSSVRNILCRILQLYPYKLQSRHELLPADTAQREAFAKWAFSKMEQDPTWVFNILWTDEAHFSLHGDVNNHNCRIWATSNPREYTQKPLHSPKVTAWCGFTGSFIIGPFFFETQCPVNGWIMETVNAQRYLTLLRETVVPCLIQRGQISNVTFMQDGATSHTANPVKAFLIQMFGEDRIVSRRCRYTWTPRSPDLTTADFWLWGYLKSRVYLSGPLSLSELNDAIRREVSSIHPDMLNSSVAGLSLVWNVFSPVVVVMWNIFWTAMAGTDVVQSGRPIFDDFFQHLWPYIGNNTANVVFQMVKRLWLIRIDQ